MVRNKLQHWKREKQIGLMEMIFRYGKGKTTNVAEMVPRVFGQTMGHFLNHPFTGRSVSWRGTFDMSIKLIENRENY